MALGRIKGITIELNVDGDKAIRKLDEFERAANKVGQNLKDINKVLKLNPASTEALTQKQKALAQQVQTTTEQLKAEEKALKDLQAGEQTEKAIKQQEKLKLQIAETTEKLKQAKQEYREFGSVAAQQIAAVGEKLKTMGEQMAQTGGTMTRNISVPIAALGTVSVKELANFEQGMAKVGAVSQASGEQVDEMSAYARNLAATTQFTAGEVTEAYNYMALAGWKPTEMMEGLEGTLNLVAASGEDLGTVSDILTDGLTAFGYSAQEAGRFGDVLAVAMSHSNTTVGQLGEAFKYIGPVAGAMGYEVEDLAVALGTMANAGIKGSTAGTTLRNLLTNMAKPTDEMATAMDILGVSLEDDNEQMYSFQEVMEQFRSGLGNIKMPLDEYHARLQELDKDLEMGARTEEEYAEAVAELSERAYGAEGALMAKYSASIAGKRGMAGLMAIVSASDEDWESLTQSINNADGAAEGMRETMENTLSGQLTILKSQLSELAMQFGEALMPSIKSGVEWLQGLVQKFQELSPETKEMIAKIAAVVAAIGPALFIVGKITALIGSIMTLVPMLTTALGFILSPIGAIVAAVAAVIAIGVVLYKNWDKIKEYAKKVWGAIRKFFETTLKKIKDTFTKIFGGIRDFIAKVWTAISSKWKAFWDSIGKWITAKITAIRDTFKRIFTSIRDAINTVWTAIWNRWKTFWENIGKWITTKITNIKNMFSRVFTAIRDTINNIWNAIWTRWSTFWTNVGVWITTKVTNIKNMFARVFTAIRDTINNIWTAIWNRWSTFWTNIGVWITTKVTNIKNMFARIFTAIRDTISNVWTGIRDKVVSVWTNISGWLSEKVYNIKENVVGKFQDLKESIGRKMSDVWEKIKAPFDKAYEKISPIIEKIKNLFPIKAGNIFSGLKLPKIDIISFGTPPWGLFGKGSPPELDLSWHKDAMKNGIIMNKPTIFGMTGNTLHGAGEAGSETLVGTGSLMSMIQSAVRQSTIDPALIYEAVRQGASDATIKAYLSGKDITSAVNNGITLAQTYNARFQGV